MSVEGEPQPAWILHARPYRETSLLLDALTLQQGRVGCVARGVRGARAQPLRAALQPLQPMTLRLRGSGELLMLVGADVHASALSLGPDALLSAFYVNELVLALLPRHEPMASLFWRYGECLNALAAGAALGWTLRCFERDLLAALGYALALEQEARSGHAIDAAAHYRYAPDRGALAVRSDVADAISGAALLALRGDVPPPPSLQTELRRLMREVIRWHLGGRELRSWRVIAELGSVDIHGAGRAGAVCPQSKEK